MEMGEKENHISDVNMINSEISFDNLIILKELGNLVNLVKDEEFIDTVPKTKLRRVKWGPMFSCLKQRTLEEMVQELNAMWEYENMTQKLEMLEKQKEKFSDLNTDCNQWRPQLGDVKAQLKASDVANLKKQKILLESLAREYEARVNKLKKILSAKRGYLKALQMDANMYQKRNDELIIKMNEKLENHGNLIKTLTTDIVNVEKECWIDKDMELE